jgi:hypothetical protein
MDSLITAAARALARGDPIGALKQVALRDDAPGLALRGIAMAQLGELARARLLLRRAHRAFGAHERVMRARCVVAEAEVALAARDLAWPTSRLAAAREVLARHGDGVNAAHARYIETRRLVLAGRLAEAQAMLDAMPSTPSAALRATHALLVAHIAMRQARARAARGALQRALRMTLHAGIPALASEVAAAEKLLHAPVARLSARGRIRILRLPGLEALAASPALLVDALHSQVRRRNAVVRLTTRPVLFALLRVLAEAWPAPASRQQLALRAFRMRRVDESVRARLRVEIGRLRKAMAGLASIEATDAGYALQPRIARTVLLLLPPADEAHPALLALLADRESWSTSALAMALGTGQRSVQRALRDLERAGKVHALGHGRARRWVLGPVAGITTLLLLPATMPTH